MRVVITPLLLLWATVAQGAIYGTPDLRGSWNSKDPYIVGSAFEHWINAGVKTSELAVSGKILLRGDMGGHQSLQSAVLSRNMEDLVQAFAEQGRGGQRMAAMILATDASMKRSWNDSLPYFKKDEDSYYSLNPVSTSSAEIERHVQLLVTLLGSRDEITLDFAMVAAGHYGYDHSELSEALLGREPKGGPQLAAQLLYRAKTGKELPAEDVAQAFSERKRQAKEIDKPTISLSLFNVMTPSAALAAEAVGIAKDANHVALLHEALKHDDVRVQIEAALACGRIGSSESAEPLAEAIESAPWPTVIYASNGLAHCPDRTLIPRMAKLLKKSKGRFRQHILFAISACAGNQYGRTTYDHWMDWWDKGGKDEEFNAEDSKKFVETYTPNRVSIETKAYFYDLPVLSNRLAFVVDRSGSMSGEKIEQLQTNLTTCIAGLQRGTLMNIIAYDNEIEWWQKKLSNNLPSAHNYAKSLTARGGTNIYDPSHMGAMLQSVDSVYLLTDGSPGSGQFTNWGKINASLTFLLRYRPVAVHTIAIHAGSSTATAMKQLAEMNHGTHLSLE